MAAKLHKQAQKKSEAPGREIVGNFLEYLTVFLTALLVLILPLALKNGYYKVGDFKFQIYFYLLNAGMAVLVPLSLVYFFLGLKSMSWKQRWQDLSLTDRMVLFYLLATLLSFFVNSAYMKSNFMGYSGWYMGLYAQLTFGFLYYIMSRFGKDYRIVLFLLAAASLIAYLFGILHRLNIDPIHTYDGLDAFYRNRFLSTLGQASWYSGFLCSFLPFVMGVYLTTQRLWLRIASGIFCFVGFMTLVTQNSDSAYFAITAVFLVLLYGAVSDALRLLRLLELFGGLLLAARMMQLLFHIHPNPELELDQISLFLIHGSLPWAVLALVAALWALFWVLHKKERYQPRPMVLIRNGIYVLALLFIAAMVLILVLGARGAFSPAMMQRLEKLPYLVWTDQWGNARGFTWSVCWRMIREFAPLALLLGVGPDGFASYGYEHYAQLIRTQWGDMVLTNAHNEWMTMVIDGGLVGAVLYAGIFLTQLARLLKRAAQKPYLVAFAACIGSYMAHNLFCYQDVLCTPFLFLLMGCAEWELRHTE